MTEQQTVMNPFVFLEVVYELNPLVAVRVANQWGGASAGTTRDQSEAAWLLQDRQTVFPRCGYCEWAIVEPHEFCLRELAKNSIVEDDDAPDEMPDFDDGVEDDTDVTVCGVCGEAWCQSNFH